MPVFKRINELVHTKYKDMIEEKQQMTEDGTGRERDFMNDFATEEFLQKNVRVRPVSGVTKGDNLDGPRKFAHFLTCC